MSKILAHTSQSSFSRALRTLVVLGELTAGSVPYGEQPLDLAGIHFVEEVHERVVLAVVQLGKPVSSRTRSRCRRIAVHGLQQAYKEFGIVRVVVGRLRITCTWVCTSQGTVQALERA